MVLKGISPLISPLLLKILAEMGHGDEILLADAHFPSHSICAPHIPVIRADGRLSLLALSVPPYLPFILRLTDKKVGITVSQLLAAIIPLFELDTYGEAPVKMMAIVPGDSADPAVKPDFRVALGVNDGKGKYEGEIEKIERFAFYERVKAFAIVVTGETRKYGNVILKKGVVPL